MNKIEKLVAKGITIKVPTESPLPCHPELIATPTFAVDQHLIATFNHTGAFAGFTTDEMLDKFLLAKVYYKTKGTFKISTWKYSNTRRQSNRPRGLDNPIRKVNLYSKVGAFHGFTAIEFIIDSKDLVDMESQIALATEQLKQIQNWGILDYSGGVNVFGVPNEYKLIPDEMRKAAHEEVLAVGVKKRQMYIDFLNDIIKGQNVLDDAEKDHGINLKF